MLTGKQRSIKGLINRGHCVCSYRRWKDKEKVGMLLAHSLFIFNVFSKQLTKKRISLGQDSSDETQEKPLYLEEHASLDGTTTQVHEAGVETSSSVNGINSETSNLESTYDDFKESPSNIHSSSSGPSSGMRAEQEGGSVTGQLRKKSVTRRRSSREGTVDKDGLDEARRDENEKISETFLDRPTNSSAEATQQEADSFDKETTMQRAFEPQPEPTSSIQNTSDNVFVSEGHAQTVASIDETPFTSKFIFGLEWEHPVGDQMGSSIEQSLYDLQMTPDGSIQVGIPIDDPIVFGIPVDDLVAFGIPVDGPIPIGIPVDDSLGFDDFHDQEKLVEDVTSSSVEEDESFGGEKVGIGEEESLECEESQFDSEEASSVQTNTASADTTRQVTFDTGTTPLTTDHVNALITTDHDTTLLTTNHVTIDQDPVIDDTLVEKQRPKTPYVKLVSDHDDFNEGQAVFGQALLRFIAYGFAASLFLGTSVIVWAWIFAVLKPHQLTEEELVWLMMAIEEAKRLGNLDFDDLDML